MCRVTTNTKEEKKNLKRRKSGHGKIMRHDSNKPHWEKIQNFTLLIIVDSLSVNSDALTTFFMR